MKGFIASVLAIVPELTSQTLHTPVHLAFSYYDKEVGCRGDRRDPRVAGTFGDGDYWRAYLNEGHDRS